MPKATIPIYADDDFERMAELGREVKIAERNLEAARQRAGAAQFSLRVGDDHPDAVRIAEEALEVARVAFNEFVDEASERAEMWVLKPIGHEEFRELLRLHPPRKVKSSEGDGQKEATHPDDDGWDVNTESFPKALLLFVDPEDEEHRTILEPEFSSVAAMNKRVKRLSSGEFETMWTTALMANKGGVSDPKLAKFSTVTPRSVET